MPRTDAPRILAGGLVAAGVALLLVTLMLLIAAASGGKVGHMPDISWILTTSTIQAGLSTIFSLAIGMAMAWAFNRVRFPGRSGAVGLLSAALVTPGLVVVFGLLAVWGRAGWVNTMLAPFDLRLPSIFGLWGIVYAHVILDATFAAALLLPRLDGLPPTRLRLGRSLALTPWTRFRVIDWPALRPTLPGLAAIIFLLSFTSFPVVLTLGGGPANQTLEVAIYSAVRQQFDLGAAVRLALVQLAISAILIVPASALSLAPPAGGYHRALYWPEPRAVAGLAWTALAAAAVFLGLPLVAVLFGGLEIGTVVTRPSFWSAVETSMVVGIGAALLALLAGLAIAGARARISSPALGLAVSAPVYLYLAMPGVTLAFGFFLGARALGIDTGTAGRPVLIIAGALLALPYAVSTLTPALTGIHARYSRLALSLRLTHWQRWRLIEWPLIGREIGLVLAIAFCFSLGDLGVISLFGTQDLTTLSSAMQRALGAYRSNDAAAIAALMLTLSIAVFILVPRFMERLSRART